MRIFVIAFLVSGASIFFITETFAQGKRDAKLAAQVWGPGDVHGKVHEVPEKWKDASAVILYQEFTYDYDQYGLMFQFTNLVRQRIRLQDAAAVEAYSELSFSPYAIVGMRHQKPNCEVKTLDFSKAILAKGDHGDIKKMPVDDLAPGDILDYYYSTEQTVVHSRDGFDPIISVLSGEYPIVEQKFVFLADKRFHFTFQSLNGAPEIRPLKESDREIAYQLTDRDRAPGKPDRWNYRYREEPTLKFKMLYLKDTYTTETMNITSLYKKGEMSTAMTDQDVLALCKNFITAKSTDYWLDDLLEEMEFPDMQSRMEFIYGYFRKKLITNEIRNIRLTDGTRIPDVADVGLYSVDFDFVNQMGAYLRKHEIPYQLVVAMPGSLGVIDDLLMVEEIVVMIKAEFDTPVYYARPTLHSVPGWIPYLVDGTTAYILEVNSKNTEPVSIKKYKLPVSSMEQNHTDRHITVNLEDGMEKAQISINTRIAGYNREDYQNAFLQINEISAEDDALYPGSGIGDVVTIFGNVSKKENANERKAREEKEAKMEKFRREDNKLQAEIIEAWLRDDFEFDITTYDKYEIRSMGRYPSMDTLVYYEECTTNSILSRAGKNFLLDAPKLIGEQVAIAEKELERASPVYMPFPRSFDNTIIVNVPDGFVVGNLDKLITNVSNETGGFVSTATMQDKTLIITTRKYYNHDYEPVENWQDLVAFLNAAYDFTQQKVLIRPAAD